MGKLTEAEYLPSYSFLSLVIEKLEFKLTLYLYKNKNVHARFQNTCICDSPQGSFASIANV